MARLILLLAMLALPGVSAAAGAEGAVQHADVDVGNQAALQRGAKYFVNYCLGCHSLQYVRYNRVREALGLSEKQLIESLMFTGERPFDTMSIAMEPRDAERWFGVAPPDLSLIARSRGPDWIYSFLQSFYVDPSRPTGTNNTVLENASMPHVLWELQGVQEAVYRRDGDAKIFDHFELVRPGALAPEEFERTVRDITTFLAWAGEPMRLERERLGIKVLLFLVVFFVFAWLYYKEVWKNVK